MPSLIPCSFCGELRAYLLVRRSNAWHAILTHDENDSANICVPCVGLSANVMADAPPGTFVELGADAAGCIFCGSSRSRKFVAGQSNGVICAECVARASTAASQQGYGADLTRELDELADGLEKLATELNRPPIA
jgi:hypothetical protein